MKLKHVYTVALAVGSLFALPGAQAATITWVANGTFTDNTVLGLAGTPGDEVYGVDFGGSGAQTTANGYTFKDYGASGNMSISGGPSSYNNYFGGGSTGDAALNSLLNYGIYGGILPGALNNLTIGQTYSVIALLADNRVVQGSAMYPNGAFEVTDGVTTSSSQAFSFSPTPAGGYIMGTFTADATSQAFTIEVANNSPNPIFNNGQYNAVLLETTSVPEPAIYGLLGSGLMMFVGLRRKK